MPNTLLLFGAGPGIGSHIASVFASSGSISHVVLLGRNTQRLQDSDVPFVSSASPGTKVSYLHVDLSDVASIPGVLRELDELTSGEEVEVVYYNAARIKPSEGVLSVDVQEIEEDFRVQVLSLHVIAQHYLPRLQRLATTSSSSKPALLVTTSHLPWSPEPTLLSLSLVKAAQRTQMLALHRAYVDSGVHCGLVSVQGVVDAGNRVLSPANIAREGYEFWRKGEGVEINLVEE